jgi:hypothetical protein
MDDQQKPAANQDSQPDKPAHDFDALTGGLKKALAKFQEDQTPENFAVIVTALSEFGISGADLWHQVAAYSKRHPLRMALFAGLAFFAYKGLAPIAAQRRMQAETVH